MAVHDAKGREATPPVTHPAINGHRNLALSPATSHQPRTTSHTYHQCPTQRRDDDGGPRAQASGKARTPCGPGGGAGADPDPESTNPGGAAAGGGGGCAGGTCGDPPCGAGEVPRPRQLACGVRGDHSPFDVRGTGEIHRRRRRDGLPDDILGHPGGGIDGSGSRGEVEEVQDEESVAAQHETAIGGRAGQSPSRRAAAGGQPSTHPLTQRDPDGRALREACAPGPRARRAMTRERSRDLEPPPWPGDRGEGRSWRGMGCVFAHLKGFLQQWSVLCDATQSVLLQRCILLLDKCKGELLRIAWR